MNPLQLAPVNTDNMITLWGPLAFAWLVTIAALVYVWRDKVKREERHTETLKAVHESHAIALRAAHEEAQTAQDDSRREFLDALRVQNDQARIERESLARQIEVLTQRNVASATEASGKYHELAHGLFMAIDALQRGLNARRLPVET